METAYETREKAITLADITARFGGGGGGRRRSGRRWRRGGFGMVDSDELQGMRDQRRRG